MTQERVSTWFWPGVTDNGVKMGVAVSPGVNDSVSLISTKHPTCQRRYPQPVAAR